MSRKLKQYVSIYLRIISSVIRRTMLKIKYLKQFEYGERFLFRKRFNLVIEPSGHVCFGKRVFFNNDCSVNCVENIKIGDYTIFGENVKIYDHNHIFNKKNQPITTQGLSHSQVTIGSNCWIGSNVVILKGAVIGDNCVIGAGCIINCPVKSGTIIKQSMKYKEEKIRDR